MRLSVCTECMFSCDTYSSLGYIVLSDARLFTRNKLGGFEFALQFDPLQLVLQNELV